MPKSAEELFASALELTNTADRAALLDRECTGNPALRAEVESLLAAHEQASEFLENPPGAAAADTMAATGTRPVTEKPGDKICRYKLLQKIGEGGCGIVYMAEQEEPIHRRVALKVIKLGMDTRSVIARFQAERQALALMDHPNIAMVLDAGATDTGRPYFVMELVKGIKITDYCDQNNLTTRERLDLFIQVCHAIQHAHQKGIIHRDIKPSNILVTLHNGVPVPKVIDFGIAKATTDQRLTDKTVFTAFNQFMGTPAYMSPEQAEMSGPDIDTRGDIYSLGVLLYEFLTGKTPFDAKHLLEAGLDEMRRIIREEEPARPSTRLTTLTNEELTAVSKHRQSEPAKLTSLVRGDLDWIVMKCLEKDRTRRYETVNGLTRDIERHLNHEPVVARPASHLYRFHKLVRRNQFVFAAASGVTVSLVAGLTISTILFIRESKAREAAGKEATKSRQVAQFLEDMLKGIGPSVALGRDTSLLREILDKTAQRVGENLKEQPDVEAELRNTIGEVYRALGQDAKSEQMHRKALAIRRKLMGYENLEVAISLNNLALAIRPLGKQNEAATLLREALRIQKKLLGDKHPDVASTLYNLAYVLYWQGGGRLDEAEALYRESLEMRRKLFGDEHPDVAASLNDLAFVLRDQGKLAEAESMLRDSLAIERKLLGSAHPDLAMMLFNLAGVLQRRGKLAEAESAHREALATRKTIFGDEHPATLISLTELAVVLRDQGRLTEAEALHRQALAMQTRLLGIEHPDVHYTLRNLAAVLCDEGKPVEADALLRDDIQRLRARLPADDFSLAVALGQRSYILLAVGRFTEAETLARECLAICEKKLPDNWRTYSARSILGGSLLGQKKYAEAEPFLLSGYEGLQQLEGKIPSAGKRPLKEALQRLARLCEETGRSDKAAEWKEKLAEVDQASLQSVPATGAK